ncbi:hypothetical protein G7070_10005 [Propioniciclava coleopterorum]|uniref:Uncharacterized protein n=1 Tax=Propioniciclava coleopterorum TaxID=2714937 RepID=A0A6G7Y6V6_9ACTN|nr:hypothetical protein [Propioniciclava coleopterorum]QIK72545.1 hypothetical protein G7070_10005 [Propioniciclava coleopterorum]
MRLQEVRYGTGAEWYGSDSLFGPDGVYRRCDSLVPFAPGDFWRIDLMARDQEDRYAPVVPYDDFQ